MHQLTDCDFGHDEDSLPKECKILLVRIDACCMCEYGGRWTLQEGVLCGETDGPTGSRTGIAQTPFHFLAQPFLVSADASLKTRNGVESV